MGLEPMNETQLLAFKTREQVHLAGELCAQLKDSVERAAVELQVAKDSLVDAQATLKRARLLGSRFPHGWRAEGSREGSALRQAEAIW